MTSYTVEIDDDEVLIAIKRPEDYEDVHPELVAEDAMKPGFEYRVLTPDEDASGGEVRNAG